MSAFVNGEGQLGQAPVKYAAYKPKRHSRTSSVGNSVGNSSSASSVMPTRVTSPSLTTGIYVNGNGHGLNTKVESTRPTTTSSEEILIVTPEEKDEEALEERASTSSSTTPTLAMSIKSSTPSQPPILTPPTPTAVASSSSTVSVSTSRPTTSTLTHTSTFRRVRPSSNLLTRPQSMIMPQNQFNDSSTSVLSAPTSPTRTNATPIPARSPLARPNSMILPQTQSATSVLSAPISPAHTVPAPSTSSAGPTLPTNTNPASPPLLPSTSSVSGPISPSRSPAPAPAPTVIITSPTPASQHKPSSIAKSSVSGPISPSRSPAPAPAPTVIITSPTPASQHKPSSIAKSSSSASPSPSKAPKAPYRPGFQPTGLTRFRTDEFLAARKLARDGPAGRDDKRIERTKLERRLEKIIKLHFPERELSASNLSPSKQEEKGGNRAMEGKEKEKREGKSSLSTNGKPLRPGLLGHTGDARRRTSSFFENFDIRRMSSSFIGAVEGGESIRSSEQRITPWQPDSAVSRCPLCDASFHPLSNRKHHCRLCGRVVCALAVKRGERTEPCSILFVVDPKTRLIEQVEEGVDYGVRKRKTTSVDLRSQPQPQGDSAKAKLNANAAEEDEEEEKFLKGVRICRECKPVLLRQQYLREQRSASTATNGGIGEFLVLYDALVGLEKEIEDKLLPQFEEMLDGLKLSNGDTPEPDTLTAATTATVAAERKHLLQAFTRYEALAKRIRNIPSFFSSKGNKRGDLQGGTRTGNTNAISSQERVQAAIASRAARFLEARMVGLGAVPVVEQKSKQKHERTGSKSLSNPKNGFAGSTSSTSSDSALDPSLYTHDTHATLQPLLEQESLLESYVAEATKARKFEDAKILRGNLKEIRGEIGRVVNGL